MVPSAPPLSGAWRAGRWSTAGPAGPCSADHGGLLTRTNASGGDRDLPPARHGARRLRHQLYERVRARQEGAPGASLRRAAQRHGPAREQRWRRAGTQRSSDEVFQQGVSTLRGRRPPVTVVPPRRVGCVRASEPDAESWSLPTKAWTTTAECGSTGYLEAATSDPASWVAARPAGASRGPVTWSGVEARFGGGAGPALPLVLYPRLHPPACLGAAQRLMGRYPHDAAPEGCDGAAGHTGRLCHVRRGLGEGRHRCVACPEEDANVGLIAAGVVLLAAGAAHAGT